MKVREARLHRKMTQTELYQKTGIHQGDISKIETGKSNPTLRQLKRIADALEMNVVLELVPKEEN